MIFVYRLRIRLAAVEAGGVKLRQPDDSLQHEEAEGDEAELAVHGGEVWCPVGEFVVFDDDEGGEEGEGGG